MSSEICVWRRKKKKTNVYLGFSFLFGIRTTNGVEGENNTMLHNDLRNQAVEQALLTYLERCSSFRNTTNKKLIQYLQNGYNVCQRPSGLIKTQIDKTTSLVAYSCGNNNQIGNEETLKKNGFSVSPFPSHKVFHRVLRASGKKLKFSLAAFE